MTTVEDASGRRLVQSATFKELAGLALRNAGLSIITLTLYRFWARANMRRRLWARTYVLDDPLEYGGTGLELFRGFLISLPTFFLPAMFAVYLAPLEFDRAIASLIAFGFYVCAVPLVAAARFWMRRYQLSRTRWRGIRFALAGSGWEFAAASSGWTILQMVTLGWYTPAARMLRAKLLWENARFGDQAFSFGDGETQLARGLYGPYALGWFGMWFGLMVGAIFGAMVVGFFMLMFASAGVMTMPHPGQAAPEMTPVLAAMFAGAGIVVLAFAAAGAALCWAPYTAASMRRIAALLSLDGARFRLHLTNSGLVGVTIVAALIFIFSLGLLAPLSGAIYTRYVLNRLEIIGAPEFARIGQAIVPPPGSGEGMADAFDLDFGIGLF